MSLFAIVGCLAISTLAAIAGFLVGLSEPRCPKCLLLPPSARK